MSKLSAYRIGTKDPSIWIVSTSVAAEPATPRTLPIGSIVLTFDEAEALAEQIRKAVTK